MTFLTGDDTLPVVACIQEADGVALEYDRERSTIGIELMFCDDHVLYLVLCARSISFIDGNNCIS